MFKLFQLKTSNFNFSAAVTNFSVSKQKLEIDSDDKLPNFSYDQIFILITGQSLKEQKNEESSAYEKLIKSQIKILVTHSKNHNNIVYNSIICHLISSSFHINQIFLLRGQMKTFLQFLCNSSGNSNYFDPLSFQQSIGFLNSRLNMIVQQKLIFLGKKFKLSIVMHQPILLQANFFLLIQIYQLEEHLQLIIYYQINNLKKLILMIQQLSLVQKVQILIIEILYLRQLWNLFLFVFLYQIIQLCKQLEDLKKLIIFLR
ncbi:unnamed protein product [Paramecium sonneborni]|uniref:Uncharacterized protein n=1 Tax=Paramecium sonneborni TaxID=65129 RepID=A0A8S1RPN9_9CILI|nr:unnamed protein product [Paramecium sonneborni]